MPAADEVLRSVDADALCAAFAARLVTRLVDVQSSGLVPSVVLTGGTIAYSAYRAVVDSPASRAADWRSVDFWWGDERFVPADSSDRNAGRAWESLLRPLSVDPARVHEMAASDGTYGDDVDAAASGYADELSRAIERRADDDGANAEVDKFEQGVESQAPVFDIVILGIGQDGHCASLMPGHPALHDRRPVVGVRDSPKPPPTRISLTMGPLMRSRELWWLASGEDKAVAVRDALSGADIEVVPAAGPKGMTRTLWLLDSEAAALVPER